MNFSTVIMAERTAIIKPIIVENSWTTPSKSVGSVIMNVNADAAIPDTGCVIWLNMGVAYLLCVDVHIH